MVGLANSIDIVGFNGDSIRELIKSAVLTITSTHIIITNGALVATTGIYTICSEMADFNYILPAEPPPNEAISVID